MAAAAVLLAHHFCNNNNHHHQTALLTNGKNRNNNNNHHQNDQQIMPSSSASCSVLLSQEHRNAIATLVAAAKLPDDFWSYYKAGRGRLTVPATTATSTTKNCCNKRPGSASFIVSSDDQTTITIDEIATVNDFLIFLNALRLFSFFQTASQLEAVVLPDRCIRISPSSSNFRRRGELQLCIGIARIRLPAITTTRVNSNNLTQWIKCCRFKPSPSSSSSSSQPSRLMHHRSNNNKTTTISKPSNRFYSPSATDDDDDNVETDDQMIQPLIVIENNNLLTTTLTTTTHDDNNNNNNNRQMAAAGNGLIMAGRKVTNHHQLASTTRIRNQHGPPSMTLIKDRNGDDVSTAALAKLGGKNSKMTASNRIKKEEKTTKKKSSFFSNLFACFCPGSKKAKNEGDKCHQATQNKYLVKTKSTSANDAVNEPAVNLFQLSSSPTMPPPVVVPTLVTTTTTTATTDGDHEQQLNEGQVLLLQAVHDHFVKTCLNSASTELSEFVEKTIGALFFDVRHGGNDDETTRRDLMSYDDCCGLIAKPGPYGTKPSHVTVSMCFTAERQLNTLQQCLSDKSFLTAVKSFVFPYNATAIQQQQHAPSSSSTPCCGGGGGGYLSSSTLIGSSNTYSPSSSQPMSPPLFSSVLSSSSSTNSPAIIKTPEPTTTFDNDATVVLMPSDVELFVVVRQTSIKSVKADLQPSSSSTMLRQPVATNNASSAPSAQNVPVSSSSSSA